MSDVEDAEQALQDASIIFRDALKLLDERGWRQGIPHDGRPGICLGEAILEASGGPDWDFDRQAEARNASWKIVEKHVGKAVTQWNDARDRTLDDVKNLISKLSEDGGA